jgi:parvulin-like peptidyl-prolyl isomerase
MSGFFKKTALDSVILNTLIQEEAEKRHLTMTDAEVTEDFNHLMAKNGGEKVVMDKLEQEHVSKDDFLKLLKNQRLKDKVVTSVAGDKIKVSDDDARKFYDTHPKAFDQPEQVRARHILIAYNPNQIRQEITALKKQASPADIQKQMEATMLDKKQKAQNLLNQVKADPSKFEELAKKNSDDPTSGKNGGDLGYFSQGMMVPAFTKAAFETKPGQVHDTLVETPYGFHIIEVLDRKPAEKKTFDEVKPELVAMIEAQKKQQFMQQWLIEQKKNAKIEIAPAYDFDKKTANLVPPGAPNSAPPATPAQPKKP